MKTNRYLTARLLLGALLLVMCGCREELLHDLSEFEANRLIARLHSAGLEARKHQQADARWFLDIAEHDAGKALQLLADARVFNTGRSQPLDAPSLVSSREDRQFRYERKLSLELEATLLTFKGVLEARVHLNSPTHEMLSFETKNKVPRGTASVLVVADSSEMIDSTKISAIVAGASGINSADVAVVIEPAHARELDVLQPAPIVQHSGLRGLTSVLDVVSYQNFWVWLAPFGATLFVVLRWIRRHNSFKTLLLHSEASGEP